MKNYADSKCAFGYITVCNDCKSKVPNHVDTNKEIQGFPIHQCEICKKKATKIYFVVGHAEGTPGAYWTIKPYTAYKNQKTAELISMKMNVEAFEKNSSFRFRVESLDLQE